MLRRKSFRAAWLCAQLAVFSPLAFSESASEATNHSQKIMAAETVTAALEAEVVGDKAARQRLLEEAERLDQTSRLAKSQQGLMCSSDGNWQRISESVREPLPKVWDEYETRRTTMRDTVEDHLKMAEWCLAAKLPEQRRSHLTRVIRLDPDQAEARKQLGFRRIKNEWISDDEYARVQSEAARMRVAMRKYGGQLTSIARGLESPNTSRFETCLQALKEIRDPEAIPAIELAFGRSESDVAPYALEWLSEFKEPEAAISLSRFAVFHEDERVRHQAAQRLLERDLFEYAPAVIELINAPIRSQLVTWFRADGGQSIREEFVKEGQDQVESVVLNTELVPVNLQPLTSSVRNGGATVRDLRATMVEERVRRQAAQLTALREQSVSAQNRFSSALNQRIASVLSVVGGKTVLAEPASMWKWWDEVNEIGRPELKATRYTRLYNSVRYDVTPQPLRALGNLTGGGGGECFVRGTPVMTRQGLKPIEMVRVGDLVLSKDTRSGELAWKPVLDTTQRDPTATLTLTTTHDRLQCTGGHVFWVSGRGWVKASLLKSGDILHGAEEPIQITEVVSSPVEKTFNLVVADHSNYFVGQSLILSHDVTPRIFEPGTVPGLIAATEVTQGQGL